MKLPEYIWKRSVKKQIRHRRKEVLPPLCSEGYAGLLPGENTGYVTVSAVTGEAGLLPVLRRVLAAGGEPVGITGTLLLPEDTPEQELRSRMMALERECAGYRIEVMQIEVSYSSAVREPVLQVTAVGQKQGIDRMRTGSQVHPGQVIVMTGQAGLEGTLKLIRLDRERVESRFSQHYIRQAESLGQDILRLPYEECRLSAEYGVTVMQAAGEGGIYDALWQLGESTNTGMEIELYQIPIRQETIEITELFDMDPYRLAAGGVMLMVTDRAEELVQRLVQEQIPAAVIGRICAGKERVILFHEERRFLEPYR